MRVDGIESEDELKRAQAVAQAEGTSITDYNEWAEILKTFEENGIQSTGSFSGDKAKMQEVERAVQEYVQEFQAQEQVRQTAPDNKETEKVQKASETDKNQTLKATVANATSSEIMANYMKYYHLLM